MIFVEKEVSQLERMGCVSEVSDVPHVVNPLTFSFNKSGKARLVLDCRHVNLFLHKFKFKCEDTSVAKDLFEKSNDIFVFDLKRIKRCSGL